MTPADYRTAIATLGLSQLAAGRWLGVSNKTAQRYATTGPTGAAARAVGMAVELRGLERWRVVYVDPDWNVEPTMSFEDGEYVRHDDLESAIGLPAK